MERPLKILMLDDNEDDARLIRYQLSRELDYEHAWARNEEEFIQLLDSYEADVVISDNTLPRFTGLEALDMVRRRRADIPFILVTGTVSEEYAVQILKRGADDYILKDRLARLPSAIKLTLDQKRMQQELSDYKYALDAAGMVTIADRDGIIRHSNDIFSAVSGYTREQLTGWNYRILNSGYHDRAFFEDLWSTVGRGQIWRNTICNRSSSGELFWADTSIIPFIDSVGRPYRYLSIGFDVTEKKRLEQELTEQQRREQLHIVATAIEAQEKERNALGLELHDNVNQLLAGAQIFLSMAEKKPGENTELIRDALNGLEEAIRENRRIAHGLVRPDRAKSLTEQIETLAAGMLKLPGLGVQMSTEHFDETLTGEEINLAVYRIMQEQFTNIIKYAQATTVTIGLSTRQGILTADVSDNGIGMDMSGARQGIGLLNINTRLSTLGGWSKVESSPGNGFRLVIHIPLPGNGAVNEG